MCHQILVVGLSVLMAFGAGAAAKELESEFDQVVWVQNKPPQISLLYVLVSEAAETAEARDKLVLRYAPIALREAERLTGPGEDKRPRFKGKFNVVYVIRQAKGDKNAWATGFSIDQLKEYTSDPQDKAINKLGRHTWTVKGLPLVEP
jgi:hypothetical protein